MAIRVLVVDDLQDKLKAIIEVVVAAGISRDNVDVAQSQQDARRYLRNQVYNLMILDLALPANPENEPAPDGGRQLLRDVQQRNSFNVPKYIVGITAFEELRSENDEAFGDSLWTIIHYEEATDGWSIQLSNYITHIIKTQTSSVTKAYDKDICVITALRDPEFLALRDLPWNWQPLVSYDDCTAVSEGTLELGNIKYSVVASYAHRMGMVSSALLAQKMIFAYRPRVLVMCGICAGLKDETGIGDVLLADPAWDWQSGKHLLTQNGNLFLADPDQLDVSAEVRAKYEMLVNEQAFWDQLRHSWNGPKPKTVLEGKAGPVASGSSVVADVEKLQTIQLQNRKLVGVEMEIYGLYAAAKTCGAPYPTTFAAKGVSDFADAEKNDKYRQYAAYTSARTVERLLAHLLPSLKV